jgi:23S rRNA (cytosine1962-C5)-methyltransferase
MHGRDHQPRGSATPQGPTGSGKRLDATSTLPQLAVRADVAKRLQEGHPWVFTEGLEPTRAPGTRSEQLPPGSWVQLVDPAGDAVAWGYVDPDSPIRVRAMATGRYDGAATASGATVRHRLQAAFDARRWLVASGTTTALRLLHGEGDQLPGVVCDLYDDTAVVVFDGPGARAALLDDVVIALAEATDWSVLPPIRRVFERQQRRSRRGTADGGSGGSQLDGVLWGDAPPERIVITEHGARFEVDVRHGHKTGLFLDQRDNRTRVASVAAGARVLNLFCYTGGFSVRAALAGARHVTSVDLAQPAVEAARRNFVLNDLDPHRHAFVAEDAFALLARARGDGRSAARRWDLVIVDPPSFAPRQSALGAALESYRKLNTEAMAVVEPGGLLATASCSSHVTPEAFLGVVREAARRSGRRVRILDVRGAGEDHPLSPAFLEGRYLKFLLAVVD